MGCVGGSLGGPGSQWEIQDRPDREDQGERGREIQDKLEQESTWGVLGVPSESLGLIGVSLGVAGRSPGGPRGSSGRAREAPKPQKIFSRCLGGVQAPLGASGRWGWAWGPNWEVEMLIFHMV